MNTNEIHETCFFTERYKNSDGLWCERFEAWVNGVKKYERDYGRKTQSELEYILDYYQANIYFPTTNKN
jgi:hypothetical protein